MNIRILLIIFFLLSISAKAQVSTKDSTVSGFLLDFQYSLQLPGADLSDRFGGNFSAGAAVLYKHKNWLMGIDGNYLFGNSVKNEEKLLEGIMASDGFLIDGDGVYTDVFFYERGFYTGMKAGRVFPVLRFNPNTGVFFTIGGGFLQHKIRMVTSENTVLYMTKEYKKGYDRLANGMYLSQQFGFFNIGNKKAYSFTVSFEIMEGFTKPRRGYQYDLMQDEPLQSRLDMLYGLRLSWMIPLFRSTSNDYFFR